MAKSAPLFVAVCLALVSTGVWGAAAPVSAADDPFEATVVKVVKQVEWQRAATTRWQKALIDSLLLVGDSLRTGAEAKAELRYGDGSVTRVGSLTTLTLTGDQKREIRLDAGKVWLHIIKHSAGMRVITPGAVAAVTGTELLVEVDPVKKTTDVTVFEGSVNVTSDVGNLVRVLGGTTTTVPFRAPAAPPVPLSPAKVETRENILRPLSLPAAPSSPDNTSGQNGQSGQTSETHPSAEATQAPASSATSQPANGTSGGQNGQPAGANAGTAASPNPNVTQPATGNEPKPVQPDLKGQVKSLNDPRLINGSPTRGEVKVIIQ